MTTPTPATDRDTLLKLAQNLDSLAKFEPDDSDHWITSATKLRAIASRLQPAKDEGPQCNHKYAVHSTNGETGEWLMFCAICGDERIDAKPSSKILASDALASQVKEHLAADTVEKVASDLEKHNTAFQKPVSFVVEAIVARLRALAAKQEGAAHDASRQIASLQETIRKLTPSLLPQAEEVAKRLESWRHQHTSLTSPSSQWLAKTIAAIRSLQPSQPAMPESVNRLCLHIEGPFRGNVILKELAAAVRAFYSSAPAPMPFTAETLSCNKAKGDDAPTVRVTHGAEYAEDSGKIEFVGTREAMSHDMTNQEATREMERQKRECQTTTTIPPPSPLPNRPSAPSPPPGAPR